MLQGKNIKIFRITDKKIQPMGVEYSLHKPIINHYSTKENKVVFANEYPFNNYRIGEYLGVDTSKVYFIVKSLVVSE